MNKLFILIAVIAGIALCIIQDMNISNTNVNMEQITCEHNGYHWINDHCIYR